MKYDAAISENRMLPHPQRELCVDTVHDKVNWKKKEIRIKQRHVFQNKYSLQDI
jgi:hypothetical protein